MTNRSPSGEFVCEIGPSDLYGRGEATYRLLHKEVLIWAVKKPFTLVQAGVTDEGIIVGFGYTQGENGFSEKKAGGREIGDFVVAIIAPDGSLRLHEAVKREQSRFLHALPTPLAGGVIVDGANNRFVVRVDDPDINQSQESWWTYELSSGKPLGKFRLRDKSALAARPVAGTPLTLVHFWHYTDPGVGARFALVDRALHEVWSVTWERDYNFPGDEAARDRLRHQIWTQGAILKSSDSNRFEVYSSEKSERVSFAVQRAVTGTNEWLVTELGRTNGSLASVTTEPPVSFKKEPLKLLGSFSLQESPAAGDAIFQGILGFCFDEQERIGLLRQGSDLAYSFALVESNGTLIKETSLATVVPAGYANTVKFTSLKGDRWLITASDSKPEGKTSAFWLDGVSGKIDPVSGFTCPLVDGVVGSGDGGFIALVVHYHKYTMEDEVVAFDQAAVPRWRIKQDYGDAHALFSPKDIAFIRGGRLAALDVIKHQIQFFDTNGVYASTWYLENAWGRKPSYPSEISADREGGILVYDFHGIPPIVRMSHDGRVASQFALKYQDGRVLDPTRGVKLSPSGRVWACDGTSLARVNDTGVADFVLGVPPSVAKLGGVAAVAVDQHARLYAVDERSGAVHVFDRSGKQIRLCAPEVGDFTGKLISPDLGIARNGEVYLSSGNTFPESARYVHFAADGKRLGIMRFALDTIAEHWYPLRKDHCLLVVGYHDAFIVDQEGIVLQKIQKRPDGNWLENPRLASIAADGSIALVSGGLFQNAAFFVNLYSPRGEPIRTVTLPANCVAYCFAFTGKYLASCTDSEICLFDLMGKPVSSFPCPLKGLKDLEWLCFCTNDGRELWMVSQNQKKVYRFELPP